MISPIKLSLHHKNYLNIVILSIYIEDKELKSIKLLLFLDLSKLFLLETWGSAGWIATCKTFDIVKLI